MSWFSFFKPAVVQAVAQTPTAIAWAPIPTVTHAEVETVLEVTPTPVIELVQEEIPVAAMPVVRDPRFDSVTAGTLREDH